MPIEYSTAGGCFSPRIPRREFQSDHRLVMQEHARRTAKSRVDRYDLSTLEERSHCPRRRRQPTWSFPLEEKVLGLRLQFPRWGKDKLAVLLRRQRLPVSTSMAGRILSQLKIGRA